MKKTIAYVVSMTLCAVVIFTACAGNTPTPCPQEQPPIISDFGRQAAKEFLSQIPSLFSFGFYNEESGIYTSLGGEELQQPPLASMTLDEAFTTQDGVSINFKLYDFDNNGIPVILIHTALPFTCASVWNVYRFINGEYVMSGRLWSWHSFYRDNYGQLIVCDDGGSLGLAGYYRYVVFTNDGVVLETIMETEFRFDEDTQEMYRYPTIIGLVPVFSLEELENELRDEIYLYLRS